MKKPFRSCFRFDITASCEASRAVAQMPISARPSERLTGCTSKCGTTSRQKVPVLAAGGSPRDVG